VMGCWADVIALQEIDTYRTDKRIRFNQVKTTISVEIERKILHLWTGSSENRNRTHSGACLRSFIHPRVCENLCKGKIQFQGFNVSVAQRLWYSTRLGMCICRDLH
jgi:hypothetical protein